MFSLDLKLVVYIVLLLVVAVCVLGGWLLANRRRQTSPLVAMDAVLSEALPFGVAITANDGNVLYINSRAQRLLSQLGDAENLSFHESLTRLSSSPQSEAQSGTIQHRIGARWWRYPLDDTRSLTILLEGTAYPQLAHHRAFMAQLGHELRTPLTSLIAHAEVAGSPRTPDIIRQTSLQTIQQESQRMARLVRDMLELYRLETSDSFALQPANCVLVAEEAIAQLIMQAEAKDIAIIFDADTALPSVLAQPDRLTQVFLNLLENAIKFCRPGDEIRVSLKGATGGVLCSVSDTGPGISPKDIPRVTDLLYRARTDQDGYGIGLALVKEILQRHHATLTIESSTEAGVSGTACRWLLPYSPALSEEPRLMRALG